MVKHNDRVIVGVSLVEPHGMGLDVFEMRAWVGRLTDDRDQDRSHRVVGHEWITPDSVAGLYVSDFELHTYCSVAQRDHAYGWEEPSFRGVHRVREHDLAAMARTFKTVRKRLGAIEQRHGHAATFPDAVNRFAIALRAEAVYLRAEKSPIANDWLSYEPGGATIGAVRCAMSRAWDRFGPKA